MLSKTGKRGFSAGRNRLPDGVAIETAAPLPRAELEDTAPKYRVAAPAAQALTHRPTSRATPALTHRPTPRAAQALTHRPTSRAAQASRQPASAPRTASPWHKAVSRLASPLALGLSVAALAAGCVVGPQYKGPPETKLAAFHNGAAIEQRQTVLPAPAIETWWTGFQDPVLTRIVERALRKTSTSPRR